MNYVDFLGERGCSGQRLVLRKRSGTLSIRHSCGSCQSTAGTVTVTFRPAEYDYLVSSFHAVPFSIIYFIFPLFPIKLYRASKFS